MHVKFQSLCTIYFKKKINKQQEQKFFSLNFKSLWKKSVGEEQESGNICTYFD